MHKISVVNLSKNKVDECDNFALNLSTAISQTKKKVLFITTDFAPKYLNEFEITDSTVIRTKVIPPFVLYRVNDNLPLLLLVQPNQKNQIKSTTDRANAMVKQIKVFKDNYDCLLVCLNNKWTDIDSCFASIPNDSCVYYLNASDADTTSFINLKISQKSFFILDQYVGDNKTHMTAYAQLTKILKNNEMIVLPNNNSNTYYQAKEPKSHNAVQLLSLSKKIY